MDSLAPKERVKILIDLIQYITPKLKAVGFQEIIKKEEQLDLSGISTEDLMMFVDILIKAIKSPLQ